MNNQGIKTFAIFFSVDFTQPETRRLVYLRQYIQNGLGPDVKVIADAAFTTLQKYCMVVLAEAASNDLVETAIAPCHDAYLTTVAEVNTLQVDPAITDVAYCVMAWNNTNTPQETAGHTIRPADTVHVKVMAAFGEGAPCNSLWLMNATSQIVAKQHVMENGPATLAMCMKVNRPADVLDAKRNGENSTPENVTNNRVEESAATTTNFSIKNEDSMQAYYCDSNYPYDGTDYSTFFRNRKVIAPGETVAISANVYVWKDTGETILIPTHGAIQGVLLPTRYDHYNTSFNAPAIYSPNIPGTLLVFNLSQAYRFQVKTPLSDWLSELLIEKKFAAPWPEDSYTGDEALAYTFFLQQFNNVPVNKNTIVDGLVRNVQYPAGAAFSEVSFTSVKGHLLQICDYFQYSDKWFGTAGIVNAINSNISHVSSNDLTGAASMMGLPGSASLNTTIEMIFSILASIISIIPEVGAVFASMIDIGLATYEATTGDNGKNALGAAVGTMADRLNDYLAFVDKTREKQLDIINGDWGTLQAFAQGVIQGKISEKDFEVQINQTASPGQNGTVSIPDDYIKAAAKAWSIIIYKILFAAVNSNWCNATVVSGNPESNPWTKANNRYFNYEIPCQYYDPSGHTLNGYGNFYCTAEVAQEVLEKLFGSEQDALDINPYEFFVGFNGWPRTAFLANTEGDALYKSLS